MAKISVSIDDALLEQVRERAGGNVSGWLAGAVEAQLRRVALLRFAAEAEAEFGPPTDEDRERVERWLSSATPAS